MSDLKKLGDDIRLKSMIIAFNELLNDPNRIKPDPPTFKDWTNFDPDYYHLNGLLKTGRNRTLTAIDPICGYCVEGYEYVRDGIHPNAISCRNCGHLRKSLNRLIRAKLPNDAINACISDYEFDSQDQENAFNHLMNWSRDSMVPPGLLMYGKPGNGKSTLLYIIAKHKTADGYNVKYAHHYHTFEQQKSSWNKKNGSNHLDNFLYGVDVLLLDEFGGLGGGTKNYSDWFKNTTIEFIGSIYERWKSGRMAVVITTNVYPSLMKNTLFDNNYAVLSRMQDMFKHPIEIKGPDRRPALNLHSAWK